MGAWSCAIGAGALAVLVPGTGVAVANPDDSAACLTVEAPMLDVPTADVGEPRLRVPTPQGWEQPAVSDPAEASIRLAILNPALSTDGFTPNAVVALTTIVPAAGDVQRVLDAQNEVLVGKAGATDLKTRADELRCGGSPRRVGRTGAVIVPADGSARTRVIR